MAKEKQKTYAVWFEHQADATNAAKALFAEVYESLKARGHTIEVDYDGTSLPQILSFDGFANGKYNRNISFSIDAVNAYGAYRLTSNSSKKWSASIEYSPTWNAKDYAGRSAKHNKRTASRGDMTVEGVVDFVEKYFKLEIDAVKAREKKNDSRNLLDACYKINQEFLKSVGSPARGVFSSPYNFSDRSKPFQFTMFCSTEEVMKLMEIINREFPAKLSQE